MHWLFLKSKEVTSWSWLSCAKLRLTWCACRGWIKLNTSISHVCWWKNNNLLVMTKAQLGFVMPLCLPSFLFFGCCCQAQSQLQVKLSLNTELALFPLNPHICGPCSSKYVAAAPPHVATAPPHILWPLLVHICVRYSRPGKVYFSTFLSEC